MKAQTSLALAVQERRRERRYPTNDPVEVRMFPFTATPIPATIIDVSRSGMTLELTKPLLQRAEANRRTPSAHESKIEVLMPTNKLVIFGELRYCRRAGAAYHAGVLIESLVEPKPDTRHLQDEEISFYIVGKGLTAPAVLRVEAHLVRCDSCRQRLAEAARTL